MLHVACFGVYVTHGLRCLCHGTKQGLGAETEMHRYHIPDSYQLLDSFLEFKMGLGVASIGLDLKKLTGTWMEK